MRILFLTPDWPDPADQGAKLRSSALIRAAASARHQVDVLSFTTRRDRLAPPPGLADLCAHVELVPAPPPRSALIRSWALLFDPLPDIAHRLESSAFHEALRQLDLHSYNVVQIEGLEMLSYLGTVRAGADRAAVIYDAHNAEMFLQRTMMQAELRDPLRLPMGLYSFTQWSKLGSYERIMMNETDIVLGVSEVDLGKLRGRHVDPQLIPNGVDTTAVHLREPGSREPRLLFIGPLDYRPNRDAVNWFIARVLPLIRRQEPSAELRLVGRGSEQVSADGVVGLGYLDDLGEEINLAAALVVPMRMGGGVRFKVLEAMAAGLPVVSTPTGMMGIEAEDERDTLTAASADSFATAVLRLLQEHTLGDALAAHARRLVEKNYDWGKITPQYIRILSGARRLRRR